MARVWKPKRAKEYLYGPTFIAWLEENLVGFEQCELDASAERQYRHWREGSQVHLDTVDRVLTRLGHHLWEIPDEMWSARSAKAPKTLTRSEKQEIVHAYLSGEASAPELAQRYEVSESSIRKWSQPAGRKALALA